MSSLRSEVKVPRFADEALRRARLTVVPAMRPGRLEDVRRAPFVALVVLLLAGGVAGLLAFNTSMQQASFRATALEKRSEALTAQKQSLSMALAAKRDPQTLAARAKALGMVVPPDPAFVRLSDGAVLGTPTPATGDDSLRINPLPQSKPEVLAPKPRVVRVPATAAVPQTGTDVPVAPTTTSQPPAVEKKPHHRKKAQGTGQ